MNDTNNFYAAYNMQGNGSDNSYPRIELENQFYNSPYPYGYEDNESRRNIGFNGFKMLNEINTEHGTFHLELSENAWYYIKSKITKRSQINFGSSVPQKETGIFNSVKICSSINIYSAVKYIREEKTENPLYRVDYCTAPQSLNNPKYVIIEESEIGSPHLWKKFDGIIPEPKQEKLTSKLLGFLVKIFSKNHNSILIPKFAGWYILESRKYLFCSAEKYNIPNEYLPASIQKRSLIQTVRHPSDILNELNELILKDIRLVFLFGIHVSSLLLFLFKNNGIESNQMLVPIVSDTAQSDLITAILKTTDFFTPYTVSLNKSVSVLKQELYNSHDGVALIKGPLYVSETNQYTQQLNLLLDELNHANGYDNHRCIIVLISRYILKKLPAEFFLPIMCDDIAVNVELNRLRCIIAEFDSAFIKIKRSLLCLPPTFILSATR